MLLSRYPVTAQHGRLAQRLFLVFVVKQQNGKSGSAVESVDSSVYTSADTALHSTPALLPPKHSGIGKWQQTVLDQGMNITKAKVTTSLLAIFLPTLFFKFTFECSSSSSNLS